MPKKILYAVLNWGLGHASRSISIIQDLEKDGHHIIIASNGEALVLLQNEFPHLVFEKLPAYNVQYSKTAKAFDKTIFFQLPHLTKTIKKEHQRTKELIKKHEITEIISDNRYGVYSPDIPSKIICHQLTLKHSSKITQKIMNEVHFKLLNRFQEIWVPDYEGNQSLAGEISSTKNKKLQQKLKYIGAVSRFKKKNLEKIYDFAIMLSGPEPQRTLLENILVKQINPLNQKIALIRGISSPEKSLQVNDSTKVYNLLKYKELEQVVNESKFVVCRAGYSSIMDMVKLNKKALIIPTPGQTEQEYLAHYLKDNSLFFSVNQDKIDLVKNLQKKKLRDKD